MNATFDIKVSIDTSNVSTSFSSEKIEDMDTTLQASVLKVFGDIQNRVKAQVAKFCGVQKEQPESPAVEGEAAIAATAQESSDQQENEQ